MLVRMSPIQPLSIPAVCQGIHACPPLAPARSSAPITLIPLPAANMAPARWPASLCPFNWRNATDLQPAACWDPTEAYLMTPFPLSTLVPHWTTLWMTGSKDLGLQPAAWSAPTGQPQVYIPTSSLPLLDIRTPTDWLGMYPRTPMPRSLWRLIPATKLGLPPDLLVCQSNL